MDYREKLRQEMLEHYGVRQFPESIPLNMRIIWKRTFLEYEEWKIEYDVETAATMPVEAGRSVLAYLLVPRGNHKQPLPAVICFHQCAINCVIGKEAVVGKAPWSYESATMSEILRTQERVSYDRTDQAYGHDLVHQGFVVLAPDSINCGERNIEAIRQEGQNRVCFHVIDEQIGRSHMVKHLFDNKRAVDLLQSFDFVDSEKIGAVGHSMGAGDVYDLMVLDIRVKAGIVSGDGPDAPRFLPLISPRLYIGIRGEFDGPPERLQAVHKMHADARPFYETDGAAENLILLTGRMGHSFADKLKWKAYKQLKEYFGMLPARRMVALEGIVREAREAVRGFWEEDQHGEFPEPSVQEDCSVLVNREQIISALTGRFDYLFTKGSRVELQVAIREEAIDCVLDCRIPCDHAAKRGSEGASVQTLREVGRILAEHDASLRCDHSERELRYLVSFPKANSGA